MPKKIGHYTGHIVGRPMADDPEPDVFYTAGGLGRFIPNSKKKGIVILPGSDDSEKTRFIQSVLTRLRSK